ncbi:MAG: UDP-2,3-diacylglucosamine diphosphatase LpxI [Holosporaceae bacterium]|jgi:DUF1009 family protein|nr:UDP-2,3-diacylglucosamine diphosphatase LpxI [Holosporaceae bacterium]
MTTSINVEGLSLGIICGGGDYPLLVARACLKKNINFCLLFFGEEISDVLASLRDYKKIPALSVKIGDVGRAIGFFRENNVHQLVLAGRVARPNFNNLELDKKGASWLLKLGKSIFAGDDALLKKLSQLLKEEGFEVIAGTDLIDDVFLSEGAMTEVKPDELDMSDIEKGFEVAKVIGNLDIGQSIIIRRGLIIGVECVEGTDALIDRCASLRKSSGGVLVKVSKPQQDYRMDLPVIGLNTVQKLHEHKFAGMAVETEMCIVLNRELVIEQLNNFGMFLYCYQSKRS